MATQSQQLDVVSHVQSSMGGTLQIAITAEPSRRLEAAEAARRAAFRIEAWAGRLTRFSDDSDLSRLNSTARNPIAVRPTLAAALEWASAAQARSAGVVDATLLAARLAAESGANA